MKKMISTAAIVLSAGLFVTPLSWAQTAPKTGNPAIALSFDSVKAEQCERSAPVEGDRWHVPRRALRSAFQGLQPEDRRDSDLRSGRFVLPASTRWLEVLTILRLLTLL